MKRHPKQNEGRPPKPENERRIPVGPVWLLPEVVAVLKPENAKHGDTRRIIEQCVLAVNGTANALGSPHFDLEGVQSHLYELARSGPEQLRSSFNALAMSLREMVEACRKIY